MEESYKSKYEELEERTYTFARDCRSLVSKIPKLPQNYEDGSQLIRSSGSVPANYIEANESISPKDFSHRLKICRKESKESRLWLRLFFIDSSELEAERKRLINEALELAKIFGSIIIKCKQ
ncbi:MAG TPA: four helix bundle protein [bacterium]|nr:four helix bundle protein [bacterium]